MRKVVVVEWMTIDGVVQAPGDPDEDRDGGFAHGGWHLRNSTTHPDSGWSRDMPRREGSCSGVAPTRTSRPTGRTPPRKSRSSPSR
jgi:hypothetical protein